MPLGQFGEVLQADLFHVRSMVGDNYMILGVIDEATHLHGAKRVPSRDPEVLAKTLVEIWCQAYMDGRSR